MGFPSVIYCVILPKPLVVFVELLDFLRLLVSTILAYFGLCSARNLYDFQLSPYDLSAACFSDDPTEIKRRLPVVSYISFLMANGGDFDVCCAVCLAALDADDEVRELANCRHVFHRRCIDKWVDLYRSICPLCRSPLLPRRKVQFVR